MLKKPKYKIYKPLHLLQFFSSELSLHWLMPSHSTSRSTQSPFAQRNRIVSLHGRVAKHKFTFRFIFGRSCVISLQSRANDFIIDIRTFHTSHLAVGVMKKMICETMQNLLFHKQNMFWTGPD